MNYIVYFDSGTTNSRAYLICGKSVISSLTHKIGTIDNVLSCDSSVLEKGLWELFNALLTKNNIPYHKISNIYMSGMVTSKNGIFEVPYLPVPIDAKRYFQNFHRFYSSCFKREVILLPGLVAGHISQDWVEQMNNVRGEEIELLGLFFSHHALFQGKRNAIIMPGSHTHILWTENETITGITSCMGGELFASISQNTIIKAAVSELPQTVVPDFLHKGYLMTTKYGFNRALYLTRTMQLFGEFTQTERSSYLEGVINAGIIQALSARIPQNGLDTIIIIGSSVYNDIFSSLLKAAKIEIPHIFCALEEDLAVSGLLYVLNQNE